MPRVPRLGGGGLPLAGLVSRESDRSARSQQGCCRSAVEKPRPCARAAAPGEGWCEPRAGRWRGFRPPVAGPVPLLADEARGRAGRFAALHRGPRPMAGLGWLARLGTSDDLPEPPGACPRRWSITAADRRQTTHAKSPAWQRCPPARSSVLLLRPLPRSPTASSAAQHCPRRIVPADQGRVARPIAEWVSLPAGVTLRLGVSTASASQPCCTRQATRGPAPSGSWPARTGINPPASIRAPQSSRQALLRWSVSGFSR